MTIPKKSINDITIDADTILRELTELLDKQQRVNEIGQLVYQGGRLVRLTSMLGKLLVREDRNFHSIQMIEGAYRQYSILDNEGNNAPKSKYLVGHTSDI